MRSPPSGTMVATASPARRTWPAASVATSASVPVTGATIRRSCPSYSRRSTVAAPVDSSARSAATSRRRRSSRTRCSASWCSCAAPRRSPARRSASDGGALLPRLGLRSHQVGLLDQALCRQRGQPLLLAGGEVRRFRRLRLGGTRFGLGDRGRGLLVAAAVRLLADLGFEAVDLRPDAAQVRALLADAQALRLDVELGQRVARRDRPPHRQARGHDAAIHRRLDGDRRLIDFEAGRVRHCIHRQLSAREPRQPSGHEQQRHHDGNGARAVRFDCELSAGASEEGCARSVHGDAVSTIRESGGVRVRPIDPAGKRIARRIEGGSLTGRGGRLL